MDGQGRTKISRPGSSCSQERERLHYPAALEDRLPNPPDIPIRFRLRSWLRAGCRQRLPSQNLIAFLVHRGRSRWSCRSRRDKWGYGRSCGSCHRERLQGIKSPRVQNPGHGPRQQRWTLMWQAGKELKYRLSDSLPGQRLTCYKPWHSH